MRAFIYVSTSSSRRWICPANQVNHSTESNNECGILLNNPTNPLARLPVSKSKTLYSLDSNSEQKMRFRSLILQKNTPPPKKPQKKTTAMDETRLKNKYVILSMKSSKS